MMLVIVSACNHYVVIYLCSLLHIASHEVGVARIDDARDHACACGVVESLLHESRMY